MKKALTIAGSDSSGGAGVQADLKTFAAHGVYGMSVITAVTAQNTQGVFGVQEISPEIVAGQMEAVFEDMGVDAVKIGMVFAAETIRTVAFQLKRYEFQDIVLDPVMISKSGYHLLRPEARKALIEELLPLSRIVTPNIPECEALAGRKVHDVEDMKEAARIIHDMGSGNVLVKGGHLGGDPTDVLFDGRDFLCLEAQRIATGNTHGTGCTLSSAIASNMAGGKSIAEAVMEAKRYVTGAIENALPMGKGAGPLNHFFRLYSPEGTKDL